MDKLVGEILERTNEWERQCRTWLDDFQRFDERYRGKSTGVKRKFGLADTVSMEYFRDVESVSSAVDAIIMSDQPWFSIVGSDLGENRENEARISQAVLQQQMLYSDFRTANMDCIRDWASLGTMVAEVAWNYGEKWKPDSQGNFNRVNTMDYPSLRPVPLWRFSFDPAATSIKDCEWVCEEVDMSKTQLQAFVDAAKKSGVGEFKEIEQLVKVESATTPGSDITDSMRQSRGYEKIGSRPYRVKKYWGLHPTFNAPAPIVYLIVVVNDSDWLVQMPNPFPHGEKPYVSVPFIRLKESFYGWGLGHLLERNDQEITERQNLMQDIMNFAISGIYTTDSQGQPGFENVKLRPGMILSSLKYGQNLKPIQVNIQALAPAQLINNDKKEEMRVVSGAVSTVQAITTGDTATEIRTVAAEAARRLAGMAMLYSTALRDFILMSLENNREWLPDNTLVEVTGDEEGVRNYLANKANIIPNPRVVLHLALDLDNRPRMVRNMNQAGSTISTSLGALGGLLQFFPELKGEIKELINMIVPLTRRSLELLGVRMKSLPNPQSAVVDPMQQMIAEREAARAQTLGVPATPQEVPPVMPEVAPAPQMPQMPEGGLM